MALDNLIGVGLRAPHYREIIEELPDMGWFEVHSENFLARGGNNITTLLQIAEHYPISIHGVGLSLGSYDGISVEHLAKISQLISRINPILISEHLSWGYVGGIYMHDLLPISYTEESLDLFARNIDITQNYLQREILIENPSSYIEYKASMKDEADFLVELCLRTGAKILLDVNNIFVSASNHDWDATRYINAIPENLVKEIHLAGHSARKLSSNEIILIDTHNDYICQEVWDLYNLAIQKFGPAMTLIEWDTDIPSFEELQKEAARAQAYLQQINKVSYA